jgi:hypothetical protein
MHVSSQFTFTSVHLQGKKLFTDGSIFSFPFIEASIINPKKLIYIKKYRE